MRVSRHPAYVATTGWLFVNLWRKPETLCRDDEAPSKPTVRQAQIMEGGVTQLNFTF
jgi:hypothetical protein